VSAGAVVDGFIVYIYLIIIITFHEFGHAWMASRCGDDTARHRGRVTLHPIAHMDMVGTVILPLLVIFLNAAGSTAGRFIIGWGKPVPVNVHNLRRPQVDDILVAMAGPIMNVILAMVAMCFARLGAALEVRMMMEIGYTLARLSMFLCCFNLLPVPPLDGSYLMKHFTGMSHETFLRWSQYGFFIVIVLIQFPFVRTLLRVGTDGSIAVMMRLLMF